MTPSDDQTPLSRLSRRNWTRRTIEDALAKGEAEDWFFDSLCARARNRSGWHWQERAAICWFLRHAADGQSERAAAALCCVVDGRETWHPWRLVRCLLRVVAALLAALAFLVVLVFASMDEPGDASSPSAASGLVLLASAAALAVGLSSMREGAAVRRCKEAAIESLGRLAVPASVATVARAAMAGSSGIGRAGQLAVIPVLEAIAPDHWGRLDDAVQAVCDLLSHPNTAIRLAAINALGHFAGGRALTAVSVASRLANPPEIEEALARVRPILRERQRQERQAASLLRPAHAPSDGADVLLRPAGGAPTEDPALLLRAVEEGATPPE